MDARETILEQIRDLKSRRDADKQKFEIRDNEYARAIDGLEMTLKLNRMSGGPSSGTLVTAIRSILTTWADVITVELIETTLKSHFPDLDVKTTSVSSALARLAEQGEIIVQLKGAGRRATVYARKETADPATSESAA